MAKQNTKAHDDILHRNYIAWSIVGILDYINSSMLYFGYLTPSLRLLFNQRLRYVFLPIFAVNNVAYTFFSFINLIFDRDKDNDLKTENLLRFFVSLLSSVIVVTAVVGGLFFAESLGSTLILLYAANLAITSVFNLAHSAYYFYHAFSTYDPAKQVNYLNIAVVSLVVGSTILMFGISGSLVVGSSIFSMATLGVVTGIIGAGFFAYGLDKMLNRDTHANTTKMSQSQRNQHSTHTMFDRFMSNIGHSMTKFADATMDLVSSRKKSRVTKTPSQARLFKPADTPSLRLQLLVPQNRKFDAGKRAPSRASSFSSR